jgi:hypothetical protein
MDGSRELAKEAVADHDAGGKGGVMVSLASFRTLYVTGIRVEDAGRLADITAVRFDGGYTGEEEASVGDFVRWLQRSDVRAYVRLSDGGRGPQVQVQRDRNALHLCSAFDESAGCDALLNLPRWEGGGFLHRPAHRRQPI